MEKTKAEEAIRELTLTFMYLTRFNSKDRFSTSKNNAWKGYSFKALDDLEESGLINQGIDNKVEVRKHYGKILSINEVAT